VRVRFLGSGDSVSAHGNHQASYLVQSPGATFLLDCGAMALASMKRDGIDPATVDYILLSHLHGDHFAGLPFLFIEYTYERPRSRPLVIVGPPHTAERVQALFSANYKDLATRPSPFPLEFVEVEPGSVHDLGSVRLWPFRVPHQEVEISLGLKVEVEGRTILYSGDTGWTEDLVTWSQGTDLFICECCYFETRRPFHLDYPQIAANRERFGARRLVLTHLGAEVHARRSEIAMELAHDGLVIDL
jgi:ribonuclease BN (tRNA processing enzyme)